MPVIELYAVNRSSGGLCLIDDMRYVKCLLQAVVHHAMENMFACQMCGTQPLVEAAVEGVACCSRGWLSTLPCQCSGLLFNPNPNWFNPALGCRSFDTLPQLEVLQHVTRDMVAPEGGSSVLNTCTSEALVELLIYLKRAYWPFAWDTNVDDLSQGGHGSHGGFR